MHDFIIDKNHRVVEQDSLVQLVCRSVKFMHSYLKLWNTLPMVCSYGSFNDISSSCYPIIAVIACIKNTNNINFSLIFYF